ncbi:MAG: peroxidase-related enzyme [Luteimonas sp.]
MSWITEIEPSEAEGELQTLYGQLEQSRGKVSNILKVHSLRPAAMQAHLNLYMDLMFAPGGLSRRQREMIAVVVSRENRCDYCVAHHLEALSRYVDDATVLDTVSTDYRTIDLPEADRALLDYAAKLTRDPSSSSAADIAALRRAGIAEADILLANLVIAYFNFVNRIALGLGVASSAAEVTGYSV